MGIRRYVTKIFWLKLPLVGGPALFWLVVVRIAAWFQGGQPCRFALGWLVDNPLRRWCFWLYPQLSEAMVARCSFDA
jgi:hypothetical protein